jgi:hypothetical protein
MKRLKEALFGFFLILYGHILWIGILLIWTNYLPIFWQGSIWVHFALAILVPFLLYAILGFVVGRFIKHLDRIKPGAILFWSLMSIGLIISLAMVNQSDGKILGLYTLLNYPICAFYRNAPDYGWSTGTALVGSMLMAYLGTIKGFAFQRRKPRKKTGVKR